MYNSIFCILCKLINFLHRTIHPREIYKHSLNICWNEMFSFRRKQCITCSLNGGWNPGNRFIITDGFAELSFSNAKGSGRFNSIFLVPALGVRSIGLKKTALDLEVIQMNIWFCSQVLFKYLTWTCSINLQF